MDCWNFLLPRSVRFFMLFELAGNSPSRVKFSNILELLDPWIHINKIPKRYLCANFRRLSHHVCEPDFPFGQDVNKKVTQTQNFTHACGCHRVSYHNDLAHIINRSNFGVIWSLCLELRGSKVEGFPIGKAFGFYHIVTRYSDGMWFSWQNCVHV